MSDEPNVPLAAEPVAEAKPEEKPAEKVYTQAEVEETIKKRLGKFSDYNDLKARAARADELEAAQMSELEKAQKEAEDLRNKYSQLESEVTAANRQRTANDVAIKVAEELGVSVTDALKLAPKLDGDDAEAMTASAKELFSLLRPAANPAPAVVNDSMDSRDANLTPEERSFRQGMREALKP